MNRLVLIDGNAILHRAYHALPPLTNRNGQQVNAVYGFGSIMLRIIDELKPEYLAVAFDRPEPTFRKQLYIGYQSKRKEMEAELAGQVELVHELVEAYGVQAYEKAGYEADDILGTIAKLVFEKGNMGKKGDKGNRGETIGEVLIVTGDRDLMQLVNDRVKLYMPTRGMSEGEMVGVSEVKERLGVLPEQVVDYKALVGDGSDNYPGIPGIGPKGAIGLIGEIGGIREIWEKIDTIKNENLKQKLIRGKESGELSYKLARIKTDVEVGLDLERLKVEGLDKERLGEFFRQMGFRSLLKRLGGDPPSPDNDGGFGEARTKKVVISENQQSLF